MSYAFRSRDLRYLDFGIAKGHAEYIAQVGVNNMGFATGFGDSTPLTLVPGHQAIVKAAWYYKDEPLNWIYHLWGDADIYYLPFLNILALRVSS